MNRKLARETTYKTLFSYLFTGALTDILCKEYIITQEFDDQDLEYFDRTCKGVVEHEQELKEIIARFAKGFSIDRIYKPDLAAMLLAVYEMKFVDSVPNKVAINECIDIVKRFSTTHSYSFVNGILASINRFLAEEAEAVKNGSDN